MVVVRLKGGTGNQMFQYAFGRRIAVELNCPLKLDLSFLKSPNHDELHVRRDFSLDVFGIPCELYEGNVNTDLERVVERQFHYDAKLIPRQGNILLDGYFQTPRYFESIAADIWKQFSVKDAGRLDASLREAASKSNAVCINVRRGDFVNNERSRNFHGVLGIDYILEGVKVLNEKVKDPHFYVFSDDVEWCSKHVRLDFPVTVVGHEHAGDRFVDYLHHMSLFSNFIIPNSSFAWWAVWLSDFGKNDRNVVVPKRWFLDESYCFDDLIPTSWMTI